MDNIIEIKGEFFKLVPVEEENLKDIDDNCTSYLTCEVADGKTSFSVLLNNDDNEYWEGSQSVTYNNEKGNKETWDNEKYLRDVLAGLKVVDLLQEMSKQQYSDIISVLKTAKKRGWL